MLKKMNGIREMFALTAFTSTLSIGINPAILVIALLVVGVLIIVGVVLFLRNSGQKTASITGRANRDLQNQPQDGTRIDDPQQEPFRTVDDEPQQPAQDDQSQNDLLPVPFPGELPAGQSSPPWNAPAQAGSGAPSQQDEWDIDVAAGSRSTYSPNPTWSPSAFDGLAAPPPLEKSSAPQPRQLKHEHLQFTAFHSRAVPAGAWSALLVYAYVETALEAVQADAVKFRDELGPVPGEVDAWALYPLARGTHITIVPSCQDVAFKPERVSFTWLEDWHRAKLNFMADRSVAGTTRNSEITIYAGPLIIASLRISLRFVAQDVPRAIKNANNIAQASAYVYKQIFTSYSHSDAAIVLLCRNIYKALGFDVLIDIDNLRAGQSWNNALMTMIDTCDIFQLFWSHNSAQSHYVRQEWQYALQHSKGEGFIRPVYWAKPLLSPPGELAHLHFGYIELPTIETSPDQRGKEQIATMRVNAGKDAGRIYELRKTVTNIGRSHACDISLEDISVSRLHASIINTGNGTYTLQDEGSANGTKLNDHPVDKHKPLPLTTGDKLQLGETVLIFGI